MDRFLWRNWYIGGRGRAQMLVKSEARDDIKEEVGSRYSRNRSAHRSSHKNEIQRSPPNKQTTMKLNSLVASVALTLLGLMHGAFADVSSRSGIAIARRSPFRFFAICSSHHAYSVALARGFLCQCRIDRKGSSAGVAVSTTDHLPFLDLVDSSVDRNRCRNPRRSSDCRPCDQEDRCLVSQIWRRLCL